MPVTLGNQNITSSTGNLGIGTDSPSGGLTVLHGTNNTAAPTLNLLNGGGSARHISFHSNDGTTFFGGIGRNGEVGIYVDAANALALRVNDTERMRIDSAGRVTMPNQPAFFAHLANPTPSVGSTIVFNSVDLNIGSHYNASNGIFTAPVAGVYQINVVLLSNSGTTIGIDLLKNGVRYAATEETFGSTAFKSTTCTVVVSCSTNDTVRVLLKNGSAYESGRYSYFSGFLIG